jgi:hypothetical protein
MKTEQLATLSTLIRDESEAQRQLKITSDAFGAAHFGKSPEAPTLLSKLGSLRNRLSELHAQRVSLQSQLFA